MSMTILEQSDAQMLDCTPDGDFSMHTAGPSEWSLTLEATMDDGSHFGTANHENIDTIEVDMEPHNDDEITEYEMLDYATGYSREEGLTDVDLLDPSQAISPLVSGSNTPAMVSEALPPPEPVAFVPSSSASLLLSPHPEATPAIASPVVEALGPPEQYSHPPEQPFVEDSTTVSVEPTSATYTEALSTDDSFGNVPPEASNPDVADVATHNPLILAESHDEPPSNDKPIENDNPQLLVEQNGEDSIQNHGVSETHVGHEGIVQAIHIEEVINEAVEPPTAEVEDSGEVLDEQVEENSGGDPHEISDGVYIDPPPAVLLSFSSADERHEFCLFNHPHWESGSQSPHGQTSSSPHPSSAVLLHDRPTLYYEPLASVFEALRQETVIASIPEFGQGELSLHAYDLDLSIPEDNRYTHEVTIHDLNELHDGSELSGPLRLRLTCSTPRFIMRYHTLREHMAQLVLGGDGEQSLDNASDDNISQQLDVNEEQHDGVEHQEYIEKVGRDSPEDIKNISPITEPQQPSGNDSHDASSVPHAESGVRKDQGVVEESTVAGRDGYGEQTDFDEHESGYEVSEGHQQEYGTEVTATEATERLDADQVHRSADAEDGGDYTEHDDAVEDDDQRFGEDLPEELGGPAELDDEERVPEGSTTKPPKVIQAIEGYELAGSGAEQDTKAEGDTFDLGTTNQHEESEEHTDVVDSQNHEADDTFYTAEYDDETQSDTGTYAETDRAGDNDYNADESANADDSIKSPATADNLNDEWDGFEEFEDEGAESEKVPDIPSPVSGLPEVASKALSTRSKRSRADDDEEEEEFYNNPPPGSPDSKRARVE